MTELDLRNMEETKKRIRQELLEARQKKEGDVSIHEAQTIIKPSDVDVATSTKGESFESSGVNDVADQIDNHHDDGDCDKESLKQSSVKHRSDDKVDIGQLRASVKKKNSVAVSDDVDDIVYSSELELEPVSEVETTRYNQKQSKLRNEESDTSLLDGYSQMWRVLGSTFISTDDGQRIVLSDKQPVTSVKDLNKDLIFLGQDVLKKRFVGRIVRIGGRYDYLIDASNRVFTQNSTYIRYLLLSSLDSVDERVAMARQFALSKYPLLETTEFHAFDSRKMSDDVDIFLLILASSNQADAQKEQVDLLKGVRDELRLVHHEVSATKTKVQEHDQQSRIGLYAILHGVVYLILNRMGLTKKRAASNIDELPDVLNEDEITKGLRSLMQVFGLKHYKSLSTLEQNLKKRGSLRSRKSNRRKD